MTHLDSTITTTHWLAPLDLANFSPEQRAMHDRLMAGPRGAIVGPFHIWLRRPQLADIADAFGKYCRFGAIVDRRVAELAIMQIAVHTDATFEWDHHYPHALQAGFTENQLAELKRGSTPERLDQKTATAHAVVSELLATHRLSPASYAKAVEALGEELLIDLVGVVGYYLFVSITINAFGVCG